MENEINIQKVSETFESKVSYLRDDKILYVTVIININYKSKTFDIFNCNNSDTFKFKSNSHENMMWLATLEAIKNGINKAKQLLENEN